jgi:hypothetical protein
MIIVLITFRNSKLPPGDTLWTIVIRTGVYSFTAVLLIMYCHNYYMEQKYIGGDIDGPNISDGITLDDLNQSSGAAEPSCVDTTPQEVVEVKTASDGLPTFI